MKLEGLSLFVFKKKIVVMYVYAFGYIFSKIFELFIT